MIKKKKKSRYDPQLHALRSEEEEQRWRCGGAKTISPLSMRVCMCLNFENNDTKKASKIMESSITERAREFMQSSRKREKKKKREKKMREPESFQNQVEVKEKKKGRECTNGIRVWWTKCKRKKKEKKKRKRKRMDERKAKNQKSQFKNTTSIFL